jgi:DNA polymerase/3'-5' exonuclease PolX
MAHTVNAQIAGRLEEAARLLRDQGADPYRVNAYRRAATVLRTSPTAVDALFRDKGLDGLKELRGVGDTIARAIRELLVHGRLPMLDRLRGEADPVELLASVPGVGRRLADRLHDQLGLETLADLEAAAHDGRLETIAGFGKSDWLAFGIHWHTASDASASRLPVLPRRHQCPNSWMWTVNTGTRRPPANFA